jgi:hypothetical protein
VDGGIRATCNLVEKAIKEVWVEKRESARQGSQKRTRRNFENTRSFEQRRRRVTFVLDFR